MIGTKLPICNWEGLSVIIYSAYCYREGKIEDSGVRQEDSVEEPSHLLSFLTTSMLLSWNITIQINMQNMRPTSRAPDRSSTTY